MDTKEHVELFLASRVAKGLSPITIKWYKEILYKFQAVYPTTPPVKPEHIEFFLAQCPGKDKRRHGYYRALRCFYIFLERRHHYTNPIRLIDQPKCIKKYPDTFTPKELYTLLNWPHNPMIKACLIFLTDTGCRLGELHTLSPNALSETQMGYIARVNGKTGMRQIPISYETYHVIKGHIPFKIQVHWLGEMIHRAITDTGLTGSAHKIRHTFATLWDGDEFALKIIMGHSKFSTLEIYRHLRSNILCCQHNQYSPLTLIQGGGFQDILL